jgi:hypothetical protein
MVRDAVSIMEPDRGDTESPGYGDLGTFLATKFTPFYNRKLLFRPRHETPSRSSTKQNGVRLLQGRSLGGFSSRS